MGYVRKMVLPNNWILYGLGWLFMPRMTIGIIIGIFFNYPTLALILGIAGAIIDLD